MRPKTQDLARHIRPHSTHNAYEIKTQDIAKRRTQDIRSLNAQRTTHAAQDPRPGETHPAPLNAQRLRDQDTRHSEAKDTRHPVSQRTTHNACGPRPKTWRDTSGPTQRTTPTRSRHKT